MYLGNEGSLDKAQVAFEEALLVKQKTEQSDEKGVAIAYGGLGDCGFRRGDIERAVHYYQGNYAMSNRLGDLQGMCRMRSMLGRIALLQSQTAELRDEKSRYIQLAREYCEESLQIAQEQENTQSMLFAISGLIDVATEQRDNIQMQYECSRLSKILDTKIDLKKIEQGIDALVISVKKAMENVVECSQILNQIVDRLDEIRASKSAHHSTSE